ncbi:hypothetical protein Tco_1517214 [Tanacetum coccineum]
MVEKSVKTMKKKELIRLDEETAKILQADFDEDERLSREKDEANVALIEEWDDIQAKIEADHELVQRLCRREEEQTTNPRSSKTIMCTYLKNMEGKKLKDLKRKSFDSIQKMFDKAFKRQKVDDVQETTEVDNDQEAAKIKELMEIVPIKEEVAIDVIPLAVKPPIFSHTLKSFDREDLETMWKLVKSKHGSTRPVEGYERVLWDVLEEAYSKRIQKRPNQARVEKTKVNPKQVSQ